MQAKVPLASYVLTILRCAPMEAIRNRPIGPKGLRAQVIRIWGCRFREHRDSPPFAYASYFAGRLEPRPPPVSFRAAHSIGSKYSSTTRSFNGMMALSVI